MNLSKIVQEIKSRKLLASIVVAVVMGASYFLGAFDAAFEKVEELLDSEEEVVVEAPELPAEDAE